MIKRLARSPLSVIGALFIVAFVVMTVAAPLLATHDPMELSIAERLQPPSTEHFLGTDVYGRDIYSRVLYGSRISVRVAVIGSLLAFFSGGLLGLVSGMAGGRVDNLLMRFADVLLAFPGLLLAIGISAALGTGETSIILALWIVYLPRFARLCRAAVLQVKGLDYVQAARSMGARSSRVALRHVGPNIVSPLIIQASVYFSEMILAEAALSFLGLGAPPPTPSWGNILSEGRDFMRLAPWISVFPGLFILFSVLGINLFGDGLRDVLDPRDSGR
ncbi:MAG: ABC transporter permease [Trueperaceae bacterium]